MRNKISYIANIISTALATFAGAYVTTNPLLAGGLTLASLIIGHIPIEANKAP